MAANGTDRLWSLEELRDRTSKWEEKMVDRYTKIVLTIIAAALVTLVAQNGLMVAFAQQNIACGNAMYGQPPCTVTWSSPLPVRPVIN
jgi:hypothetical protein